MGRGGLVLLQLLSIGCAPSPGEPMETSRIEALALLADTDGDGVPDASDVCLTVADPAQMDTDGDGVGNACDRPFLVVRGTVSAGASIALEATGAAPGEEVHVAAVVGSGGAGPCLAALGGLCLDLGAGATELGSAIANAAGTARVPLVVPAALVPNGVYTLQAVIVRGVGGADSVSSGVVTVDGRTTDWDGDGLVDAVESAIGTDPATSDTDGDGLLDAEELVPHLDPRSADTDGDGVSDAVDACLAGDDAADLDLDGVADACDLCPADVDPGQSDTDGDGLGDACEGQVLAASSWGPTGRPGRAFGSGLASAGDVDGDGYEDVLVGDWAESPTFGYEGAAWLYPGSALGPSVAPTWSVTGGSWWTLGWSVASAGDVNGDGYDDVIVGAPAYNTGNGRGRALVYLGSPAGLTSNAAWTAVGSRSGYGMSVSGAGDVNGDGYDDVVVGSPYEGIADLFLGSATGLSPTPDWTGAGTVDQEYGSSVAGVGDVDGDGYDDVLIGAPGPFGDPTSDVYLYAGRPYGLTARPVWSVAGGRYFGYSVDAAGDVNGDGHADLIVGSCESRAEVYLGSLVGPGPTPDWSVDSAQFNTYFGCEVAGAGDVDGDGFDDVAVGAPLYDHGQRDEGVAAVWLGSPDGPGAFPAWLGESNQRGPGAFDYSYDPEYGSAMDGGDVDGDGLSDLLVGAFGYDDRPSDDSGKVFLYTGRRP